MTNGPVMVGGERPLVVRCGAFGDMVLITALIQALSRRFGTAVDVVTSGPWSEPLLRGQPGVGEVLSVRSRKTPYWLSRDQQRVVRRLRARGPGPTWCCDGNDAVAPMLLRAGVSSSFVVDVRDHPLLEGEHATEQWQRMARFTPIGCEGTSPLPVEGPIIGGCELRVGAEQQADLDRWLRARGLAGTPLLAVQMGNKRTMRRGLRRLAVNHKHWPLERWAQVVGHLRRKHPEHALVLLGTGPEYQLNEALRNLAGAERLHNVADDLAVPRLVALLDRSDALVTVDSGPAHAAAAVGCPLVVLFGKASTTLYRPWGTSGADVRVLTGRIGGELSMLGIGADAVTAAWDDLILRERAGGRPDAR